MRISIIIPFYENLDFLERLLSSLKIAVLNSKLSFELIIVNDSPWKSIDISFYEAIFGNSIILFENTTNKGVAYSRNVALDRITGDFVHLIDQDDLVSPFFYKEFEKHIISNVFCVFNILYRHNNRYEHKGYILKPFLSKEKIISKNIIRSPGQVIFSKSLLKNSIRFPITKHYGADDRFFWINLILENSNINFKYIHAPLYIAYIHSNNYSNNLDNLYKSCIENWFIMRKKIGDTNIVLQDIYLHLFFLGKKIYWKNIPFLLFGLFNYYLDMNKIIVFFMKKFKV